MRSKNTQKGFTLIELLVVISIISILSSVIFASLSTAKSKARDAVRYSDLRQIKTALELYLNTYNYYPTCSGDDLCDSTGSGALSPINTLGIVPTYIPQIKNDPLNNNGYAYYYARGYRKTGTSSFIFTGNNTDYIFGMRLEVTSNTTYDGWGNPNLNYLDGN